MSFAVPMVWRETKRLSSSLYFVYKNYRVSSKFRHTVKYPYLPPARRPVPHNAELPVSSPQENLTCSDENSETREDHGQQVRANVDCDPTFEGRFSSLEIHILTQGNLNGIMI